MKYSEGILAETYSGVRRPTWAEVNVANLTHNFELMKNLVGPGVAIMPTVKADAYGHGAVKCAQILEQTGADWFGVALPEEGIQLRETGITRPVLCLGGFAEGQEDELVRFNLTPSMFRKDLLGRLDEAAGRAGHTVKYHVKVDTGMGRLGVPFGLLDGFLDTAAGFNNIILDGVMTHFASADDHSKIEFTRQQMKLYEESVSMVRSRGHNPTWFHEANSAAAHGRPEARGNMVRLGGALFGLWRDVTDRAVPPVDWKPVMSLHTRVAYLKEVEGGQSIGYGNTYITRRRSIIATLPIGYEDGLRRALSNKGEVIVRGCKAPVIGRVSMDLTTVDVTDIPGVSIGDEVVIIGSQGESSITAEELAEHVGTISYEITCAISNRVQRIYVPD